MARVQMNDQIAARQIETKTGSRATCPTEICNAIVICFASPELMHSHY
jgi:hypothetical protein